MYPIKQPILFAYYPMNVESILSYTSNQIFEIS